MNTDITGPAVIAIAQDENKFKAVELEKRGGAFEVLRTKSSDVSEMSWRSFAAECGLFAGPTGRIESGRERMVVVGFDSTGVVFYRIVVPEAREEEIAAMVRLQAEARLPLSVEQMELGWRADSVKDGQVAVTIAAARREQMQRFLENARWFEPAKILLDCEGIVKAWREFFSGSEKKTVVVSIGSRNTQVCLAERGRLISAVSLDMGVEDFSAVEGAVEQTETAERFAQDMRSVLELFGCAEPRELPVFVLSDGSGVIEAIVSCLRSAGLKAEAASPEIQKLKGQTELGVGDIYEYRVPIGLGLMALQTGTEELNIFERLYNPAREEEKRHWLYSPKVAGVIAAVMLAVLLIVFYVVDVASLNAIEKHLRGSGAGTNSDLLVQRERIIKATALERPDLLGLLNQVNKSRSEEMMLDSLHFKKGQPVSINGQVQGAEQLYKFQESLLSKKAITEVKIQNTSPDTKSGKLKFTITFHYRNFTKKRTRT